ncbi:UNVERIFIED_CONTAM: hypothetical protein K2H54_018973 [Gekko kuhli]
MPTSHLDKSPDVTSWKPYGYGIVGFAMYYFTYDPWIGKLLYLEDFFVMNEFRGIILKFEDFFVIEFRGII